MNKHEIHQKIKEFVKCIQESNKPAAWTLMNKIIEAKLANQLSEKKERILKTKKF